MDKKNFNEMMRIFGKVYEKSLAPDVLKIYFEIFKEISDDKTKFITKECLKKCRYFPRPADVFECLEEEGQVSDLPDLE
jgi:hypothetical protein